MTPDVLVLDEPMAGLDPRGRDQLRAIIRNINATGVTVVQVTHSMDDAATSDQVIVLDEGVVLLQGDPHEVFSDATGATLREHGLGLPDALTWSLRLAEDGFASIGQPLTLEALTDALANVVSSAQDTSPHASSPTDARERG
jgi:energy-coupling factor transport system ATP-binding protein